MLSIDDRVILVSASFSKVHLTSQLLTSLWQSGISHAALGGQIDGYNVFVFTMGK